MQRVVVEVVVEEVVGGLQCMKGILPISFRTHLSRSMPTLHSVCRRLHHPDLEYRCSGVLRES